MPNEQPPYDPYGAPSSGTPQPGPPSGPGTPPVPGPSPTDPTIAQPAFPTEQTPVPAAGPPPPADDDRKKTGLIIGIVVVLLVLIVAGVGLALARRSSSSTAADVTASGTRPSDEGRTAGGQIEQPADETTTTAAETTTAAKAVTTVAPTAPTTTPPTKAPTTAPTTTKASVTFASATNTPTHVACPSSQVSVTLPQPTVTVAWNAPGAKTVALAVDGPGVYDTYNGATGSVTLSFGCTDPGHGQHTYALTATAADGQKATKTLVTTW